LGYVLKIRKGTKMLSGRKSSGGCLRTKGNRAVVFETKAKAKQALDYNINRWLKQNPGKTKKDFENRIAIKKV